MNARMPLLYPRLVGLFFLSLAALSSPAQTTGPLAHWRFDEPPGATNISDSAGGFTGTLSSTGANIISGGRSGNALNVDRAANGFVNCGNILNLGAQNFTVSAWIRTPVGSTNVFGTFVSKHNDGSGNGYFLSHGHSVLGSPRAAFFFSGTRTVAGGVVDVASSTTTVNDGNWHQVVGIYRPGGRATIYVDGAPVEGTIASSPILANTAPFIIGGANGPFTPGVPGGLFTGAIDDVQVYGRALSDSEIDYLFNNPGLEITATVTGTIGAHSATLGSDVFIGGKFLELGINSGGSFGSKGGIKPTGFFGTPNRPDIGMSTDLDGFGIGTVESFDYFLPGTPYVSWSAGYKIAGVQTTGFNSRNGFSDGITPVAVVNTSAGTNLSATTTGTLGGNLKIVQRISFGVDKKFFKMQIGLTNVGTVTLNSVRYMWDVDPDNTVDLGGSYTTVNTITNTFAAGDGKAVVVARSTSFGSSPIPVADLVLYTVDSRGVVFRGGSLIGVANALYDPIRWDTPLPKGNTATEDSSVAMTTDVGTLAPGRGTSFTFYIGLGLDVLNDIDAEVQTPTISVQPLNYRVLPGTNVAFTVSATSPTPLTYQWFKFGTALAGATNASLSLTNVQLASAGDYYVVVNNDFGIVTSINGNLEVLVPPSITVQPVGASASAGDTIGFSVAHTGSLPFTYQWQLNGTALPGATNITLTLANVQFLQAGNYTVAISNLAGGVISSNALLFMTSPPFITAPPVPRTISAGRAVTFTAGVVGSLPLTYQWRQDGTNLPGANGSSLTFAAAQVSDRGLYTLVITNVFGSVTSAPAFLAVHPVVTPVGWVGQAGGPGTDVGNACAADTNGNFYVAGYFTGTATFGTNTLVSAGLNDVFVMKYDNAGTLLWARRAGGPGFDAANGIAVDDSGNTYVTGSFEGSADFGGTTLTNANPGSYSDIFVTKLDANGTVVWARGFGADSVADVGQAIALDPAGNVLVAGSSALTNFGGLPVQGAGRIFLAKLDGNGNPLWARTAGVAGFYGVQDVATGVGVDTSGNVHLAGNFAGPTATFDTVTLTNRGVTDGFLARFDSNGVFQRVLQIGGPGTDHVNALAVSPGGVAHVGGDFTGTLAMGVVGPRVAAATATLTSRGQNDGFVAQFDPAGALAWVQTSGGAGPDSVRGLALDTNGTVHVTGFFSGLATFGTNTLASAGATLDIFTANYTSNGFLSFAQQSGGADLSGDFGNAIAVDPAGNSFVAGQFSGTTTLGSSQPTRGGGGDVFVARFNAPQMAPPPVAFRVSNGQLILTWPVAAFGWGLQNALANPLAGGWQSAPHTITVVGDEYVVTIPLNGQKGFFRLVR